MREEGWSDREEEEEEGKLGEATTREGGWSDEEEGGRGGRWRDGKEGGRLEK